MRKTINEAGKMAQQLRALATPPEDLNLISNTHMTTHNCL